MFKWTNARTNETFSGDTIGSATTSYDKSEKATLIYLGSLNVSAMSISGKLSKKEAHEYLLEWDWIVEEI